MNKVALMGRLTRDPDIRYTSGPGEPLCIARYTLAVDRRYRKQDGSTEADFISCVAFGKSGEFAEKFLRKGMKVAIVGRIQTGSYEKEGRKVYTTDVVAEEQEFCESKRMDGRGAAGGGKTGSYSAAGGGDASWGDAGSSPAAGVDKDGFMEIPDGIDEELPFA